MKKYLPLVLIAALLFSCKGNSNETKVIGSWNFDGASGKSIVFEKGDKCYALAVDATATDTVMKGTYSFINDGKKMVTKETGEDPRTDTVSILELNDHVLKIINPRGDTIVLNKK
jgi:hypothetical protein